MPIASKRDDASLLNHDYVRFDEFFGSGPVSERHEPEKRRRDATADLRLPVEKIEPRRTAAGTRTT